MKKPLTIPPVEFLNECFTYDPENGKLFWKERPRLHFKREKEWKSFNRHSAGCEAGTKMSRGNGDRATIMIVASSHGVRFRFMAHLAIHAMMGVTVPNGMEVDHRDLNPWNNRWMNLRISTPSQNRANVRNIRTRKHKLPKGVHRAGEKYYAQCGGSTTNVKRHLGMFDTVEEAHEAYCRRAKQLYGNFARGN